MDGHKFRSARRFALVAGAVLIGVAAFAGVVTNSLFELGPGAASPLNDNGTGTDNGVTNILGSSDPGPDWGDLFDANGAVIPANVPAGGTATFIRDDVSGDSKSATPDLTTYTSKGSDKNTDLVSTWNWGSTNVPAKNDITNAYVYGIHDGSGDLIVYFGGERSAPNGASHMDIELFQANVALDEAPPCDTGADCGFTGEHTAGDLLISMDYTQGGALGVVEFRKRNAANTGYDLILTLTGEGCNTSAVNGLAIGEACAFNNAGPINGGPWPNFDSQANVITVLPTNAFTEWGVNASNALNAAPCFPTVQVKTRSSPSFTAELKDFAVRPFQSCVAGATTQIHAGATVGATHNATDIQGNTVPVLTQVHDKAIVTPAQAGAPTPTGNVMFRLYPSTTGCASGPGASCVCTGTPQTETLALVDLLNGTAARESSSHTLAAGNVGFRAFYLGDVNYPVKQTVEGVNVHAVSGCEPITVARVNSAVNTDIRLNNVNGTSVLNQHVQAGTVIVDVATISGGLAQDPTGVVTFRRFASANCSGSFTDTNVNLVADSNPTDGIVTAVLGPITTTDSSFLSFAVTYSGDVNYNPSAATVCEPICSFNNSTPIP